jgi:hypothetical protein
MKKLIIAACITLSGCAAQEFHTATFIDDMESRDVIPYIERDNKAFLVCFGDRMEIEKHLKAIYKEELSELRSRVGTYATQQELIGKIAVLDRTYSRRFLETHIDDFSVDGLNYSDAEMCKKFFEDNRDYLLSLK